MIIVSFGMGLAYVMMAGCLYMSTYEASFYVALIAATVQGSFSAIGETTILGFLKEMPGETIGYFGSGTGAAGISGSGLLLLLKSIGMDDTMINLSMVPFIFLYLYSFS
mmetsp:Transcript_27486/g.19862  ORF Transcript_27486/g.19862 Transcript_27486/m.19862 type:complete len:109 (+) Transcript_27486:234-560(+)